LVESNNVRIQSNFNKAWRQHQITAIAGWELRRANRTGNRTRLFGYNDRTLVFSPVDLTRQYPIINGSGSQYITDNTSVFNNTTNFISYFSNASYTFKGRYSLSASGRRDASNLFGLRTNDQWNPFWSVG